MGKPVEKVAEVQSRDSLPLFYVYIAPEAIDATRILQNGMLPMTKKLLSPLRAEGLLQHPGDRVVVLNEKGRERASYQLLAVCETTNSPVKIKDAKQRYRTDLKYAMPVITISIGQASKSYRPSSLGIDKPIESRPALLRTSESAYQKALESFPLTKLSERMRKIASKEKVAKKLKGLVFDFSKMQICKVSDLLPIIDDTSIEEAIKERLTRGQTYEMVNRLYREALRTKGTDLYRMEWSQFEDLCAQLVQCYGMEVQQTKRTSDGGVDFFARDEKTPFRKGLYIFQVKRTASVGVEVVRQLYSVICEYNAVKGIILTTGSYTRDAIRASETHSIELIDGAQLKVLFGGLK